MGMGIKNIMAAVLLGLLFMHPAFAGDDKADKDEKSKDENSKAIPDPTQFITKHKGRFNGQLIEYTATAGETYLLDKDGKPKASIFTFAYTKTNLAKGEVRPVTFLWNGGPGSASTWLHMGTFGPKRVAVPSDARDRKS
ncbi:MAG: peptidase S10, partial [Robiginitomaculum sp.]